MVIHSILFLLLVSCPVNGRFMESTTDDDDDDDDDRAIDEIITDSLAGVIEAQGGIPRLPDGTFLTELDIQMTAEEYEEMRREELSGRSKRKAVRAESKRWTGRTIPYVIDDIGFDNEAKDRVRTALDIWEEHTCLTFRPSKKKDIQYVKFFEGKGCSSAVGMRTKPQKVNLGPRCKGVKTILHEVGHAIGLHHEQTRPDRDSHIWVRIEYMQQNKRSNSNMKTWEGVNDYGVTYDYSSIMHYGPTAFKDPSTKEPVMITHDPSWQFRIGKAKMLSFKDIKTVNRMYDCSDRCGGKTCPGEGFLDKNCRCICPGEPTRPCGTPETEIETCFDTETGCSKYRQRGLCPKKMKQCARTCGFCGPKCSDDEADCFERAQRGECKGNPVMMFAKCKKACGLCWGLQDEGKCKDDLPSCAKMASEGRCVDDEAYMTENCKRSCARCST